MKKELKSIRTFLGARDFQLSSGFYLAWGFQEHQVSKDMSHFHCDGIGFYLQDYYV